LQPGFGLL